jgi:hypothetical protein
MISLSQSGPIDDLIIAVENLPVKTETVSVEFAAEVKTLAVMLLRNTRTETINGAQINLTANCIPSQHARQCDIQVCGKTIKG